MSLLSGLFGPPDVRSLLARSDVRGLAKATTHSDETVRTAAIDALSMIAIPVLERAANIRSEDVTRSLVRSIQSHGRASTMPWDEAATTATAAITPIVSAMGDGSSRVRAAATGALGRICASKGVKWISLKDQVIPQALQKASADESAEVRRAALVALAFLVRNVAPPNPLYGNYIAAVSARVDDENELVRGLATWMLAAYFERHPAKPEFGEIVLNASALAERARAASGIRAPLSDILIAYCQYPDGLLPGIGAAAIAVRNAGERLSKLGGTDAMREAHARFAQLCPFPGAARNLEILWDGIGSWRS